MEHLAQAPGGVVSASQGERSGLRTVTFGTTTREHGSEGTHYGYGYDAREVPAYIIRSAGGVTSASRCAFILLHSMRSSLSDERCG